MATLNYAILNAAFEDGLIGIDLTTNQRYYLERSVLTANLFLAIIRSKSECSLAEIVGSTDYHENTCKQYLRWLAKHKFIKIIAHEIEAKDGRIICNLYKSI